jgi:hypothetical protein
MPAPRLLTTKLMWRNRRARAKVGGALALLLCGALIAAFSLERDAVAPALDALRRHGYVCSGMAAAFSAILVARRRVLERAQFLRSWLAAVPVRPVTARCEALLIETFPASAALVVISVLALIAAVAFARLGDVVALWADLCGGVVLGIVVGYLMPAPKPVDLPPGSRYVPHRQARHATPIRPSLKALGQWPLRQMFAWAQPKAVARATIPILVMMPLGTMADTAMVVIALFGVVGTLLLLWSAAISVSRLAARWLAPLPVRADAVVRAFLLPAYAFIAGASAMEALLLAVFNVSYRGALMVGASTAVIGCLLFGGALLWNVRPRRMQ